MEVKRIVCTVTNDLNYDQRMIRICTSLVRAGYEVLLVGRNKRESKTLRQQIFQQKRLPCFFQKGKWFYVEYNIRLFFFLLKSRADVLCAIDLDTILPVLYASRFRRIHRVYDAHELFCEMEEIVSRPLIYKIWKVIERKAVPQFKFGYTIGVCYAEEFRKMYDVHYAVVRNATVLEPLKEKVSSPPYILYQGAVNEGRSFETLIPAMQDVPLPLTICGEGNFFEQAKQLVFQHGLQDKISFEGYVDPQRLKEYTRQATIGITLFTNQGKSNYLSMANRFFDYMHFAIPQLCVAYPEYQQVNEEYEVALLIEDTSALSIACALNRLWADKVYYQRLKENCLKARQVYSWQEQEKTLIQFYKQLLD